MKRGDRAILAKIVSSIERGNGRVASCKAARLNYQTFLNWLNPNHANYDLEFLEAIKKAEEYGSLALEETCMATILRTATRHGKEVWQAAAWILERKYPEKYAQKNKTDITTNGKDITPATIVFKDFNDDAD